MDSSESYSEQTNRYSKETKSDKITKQVRKKDATESSRIYNKHSLNDKIDMCHNVLKYYYHITDDEFASLNDNVEEIMKYIIDRKNIKPYHNDGEIGRVWRIVHCEYVDSLTDMLQETHAFFDPDPMYREPGFIPVLSGSEKHEMFRKYLNTFEEYENTFGIIPKRTK